MRKRESAQERVCNKSGVRSELREEISDKSITNNKYCLESVSDYMQSDNNKTGISKINRSSNKKRCFKTGREFKFSLPALNVVVKKLNPGIVSRNNVILCQSDMDLIESSSVRRELSEEIADESITNKQSCVEYLSDYVRSDENEIGINKPHQSANRKQWLKSSREFKFCLADAKVVVKKLNADIISRSSVILCQSDIDLITNSQKRSGNYIESVTVPAKKPLESCEPSLARKLISNGQGIDTGETPGKLRKLHSKIGKKASKDVSALERKSRKRMKPPVERVKPFFIPPDVRRLKVHKRRGIRSGGYVLVHSVSYIFPRSLKKKKCNCMFCMQ